MSFWILRKAIEKDEDWDDKLDAYYSELNKIRKRFYDWELIVYSNDLSYFKIGQNEFIDGVISNSLDNNFDGDYRRIFFERDKIYIEATYYCSKQCYYSIFDNKIVFSNDIRSILLDEEISLHISEEACKCYATSYCLYSEQPLPRNLSFFERIFKLDNATYIIQKNKLFRKELVYGKCNLKNFSLREVLKSEIEAYGIVGKVGISLSGGVDSSCVLQAMIDAGIEASQIIAFTLTFSDSELVNTNDVEIVKRIVKHYGIKLYIIDGNESLEFIDYEKDVVDTLNGPSMLANHKFLSTVRYLCRQNGVSVLFDGCGGDELLGGCSYVFDDMIKRRPIKTLHELWKLGNVKYAFRRIRHFVFEPIFIPWLYERRLWGESEDVTLDFFTKEQYNIEKKIQEQISEQYSQSRKLKSWGKRFIFDFSKDVPGALQESIDGIVMASPFYRHIIREYAISANCEELFDYVKLPNAYLASKKIMRDAYEKSLPDCVLSKEIKTTYVHMARKMYLNSYKRVESFFRENKSEIGKMNIVDNQKFHRSLMRMRILCEETSANIGTEYNYISGLCQLEEWLQWCKHGREYILEKCKPVNILNNERLLPYEEI